MRTSENEQNDQINSVFLEFSVAQVLGVHMMYVFISHFMSLLSNKTGWAVMTEWLLRYACDQVGQVWTGIHSLILLLLINNTQTANGVSGNSLIQRCDHVIFLYSGQQVRADTHISCYRIFVLVPSLVRRSREGFNICIKLDMIQQNLSTFLYTSELVFNTLFKNDD